MKFRGEIARCERSATARPFASDITWVRELASRVMVRFEDGHEIRHNARRDQRSGAGYPFRFEILLMIEFRDSVVVDHRHAAGQQRGCRDS